MAQQLISVIRGAFMILWAYELSWSQYVREVLEVDITSFASKSSYRSEGARSKGQIWSSSLCMLWQMIWLPAFFSYFFCQSFVDSVAFWCHSSTCCEDKGIEWRLVYVNHSVVVLIVLLFFVWLVDLFQGLPRIGLWGRMCDHLSKVSPTFPAALFTVDARFARKIERLQTGIKWPVTTK